MTGEIQLSQQSETEQVGVRIESPTRESDRRRLIVENRLIGENRLPIYFLILGFFIVIMRHFFDIFNAYHALIELNSGGTWSVERVVLLTAVLGMFSGAVYLALYTFHAAFPISDVFKTADFSTWELLTFSKVHTGSFLVITTVTTTFIMGIGANTYAICFVFRNFAWRTFFTTLSLFAVATFSVSFFAMLHNFVPYSITIAGGKIKVSAIYIVIFYDIYVITLVCALACVAQCFSSCCCKQDADVEP